MRLSVLALYQSQGNATYHYRNHCHLMHFVHKWLLIFSVTLIRLCIPRHTPICPPEPLHALIPLRSTSCDSMNLRLTLLDSISLVPPRPNTNTNLINEDIHIRDLNLYETIFQNWCLIDKLHAMTPDTNDYGVTPPNVNTSSVAFLPPSDSSTNPNITYFTGSHLDFSEASVSPCKSDSEDESKSSHFTIRKKLSP